MKVINVDVDGVLRATPEKVLEIYKRYYNSSSKLKLEDITTYNFVENLMGLNAKEFFVNHAEELFYESKPYNGARQFMEELYKDNKVNIVTDQFKNLEKYTLEWVKKHNIPYDSIHFTGDKGSVKGDYLIDDKIANLKACIGATPVCYVQPWNSEWNGNRIVQYNDFFPLLNGGM